MSNKTPSTWNEALNLPASRFFGITPTGTAKHAESFYKTESKDIGKLSFDLSNSRLLANLTHRGRVRNAAIVTGLEYSRHEGNDTLRGVTVTKKINGGGPWGIRILPSNEAPVLFHEINPVGVDLIDGLFPRFTAQVNELKLTMLAFAPTETALRLSPRAMIQVVQLTNTGKKTLTGVLAIDGTSGKLKDASAPLSADCTEAVLCLDGKTWAPEFPQCTYSLGPADSCLLAFAFLLGETPEEIRATAARLSRYSSLKWFQLTQAFHKARLGELSIPGAPLLAESLVRFEELCRMPAIHMQDGVLGGTFIGSDYNGPSIWAKNVWVKDSFYQILPMSMLAPELCATAIPFFLNWGMTTQAYGRGLERFPAAVPEIHSLSLALAPFILAGAFYRTTGDKSYFLAHPELLHEAKRRFQVILSARKDPTIFLFPSLYISDGDARGDFHTGSNLLAWYAFEHMARIAKDAYAETALATEWQAIAEKIKTDLFKYCRGASQNGPRFFEGVQTDGSVIDLHDGEESDVALMPFYGFTEADDPALLTHSRLCLSKTNSLYVPGVDGVKWVDGNWERQPVTFPGWTTALAGAGNEEELKQCLDRIAQLTDLDGSIWWWPYENTETDRSKANREPVKCGWAAGIYVCRFVHDILGLQVDVPSRKIAFRPFVPWKEFSWENCRLGNANFNVTYARTAKTLSARIVNMNPCSYEGVVELTLPAGTHASLCRINGTVTNSQETTNRFGRPSLRIRREIPSEGTLLLEIDIH